MCYGGYLFLKYPLFEMSGSLAVLKPGQSATRRIKRVKKQFQLIEGSEK
jgi:hypothetical protein